MSRSIGPALRSYWNWLSVLPLGKWIFSRAIGWMAPYSGSISARVQTLEPGFGVVQLSDHRKVRNHLKSVHAVALVNLAEIATGLTLMNSLPDNTRGILTGLDIRYLKKARGILTASCHCQIPTDNREQEVRLETEIVNTDNEVVATAQAQWLIGPEQTG